MRTMYDAIVARNIPAGAEMVAGYLDGDFAWSQADWRLFPNAVHVTIAALPSTVTGVVIDVEKGDFRPDQAPAAVLKRRAAGIDPTVYCNTDTWPSVRNIFWRATVPEPHYWIAAYPGCGPTLYPGTVAHQWRNTPGYDLSVVADHWPGVDPPDPPPLEVDMTPEQAAQLQTIHDIEAIRFVRDDLYRDLLGRPPDDRELLSWLGELNAKGANAVYAEIAHGPEATQHAAATPAPAPTN